MSKSITIKETAKLLHKSEMFVRIGLQRGLLPFGVAIKTSSKYSYYINPQQLEKYLGVDLENELKQEEICTKDKEEFKIE